MMMPVTPISVAMGVRAFKGSFSVLPLILLMTQKPLSFIHGKGLEPQPMATAS